MRIGLNYRDHAAEAGLALPDSRVMFGLLPAVGLLLLMPGDVAPGGVA